MILSAFFVTQGFSQDCKFWRTLRTVLFRTFFFFCLFVLFCFPNQLQAKSQNLFPKSCSKAIFHPPDWFTNRIVSMCFYSLVLASRQIPVKGTTQLKGREHNFCNLMTCFLILKISPIF